MPRTARLLIAALVVLVVAGSAGSAFAAPVAWQKVEVILHADQQPIMLVSGELPVGATLPCEAELTVPAGAALSWIGEILGGSPADDPQLTYVKSTANGLDVYRFTMTKARIAQVEVAVQGMTTFDGTVYDSTLGWTAPQPVPEVQISQRIPAGAQIATAAPGASLQPGDAAYSYYTRTVKDVKAGDRVDLTFSYTAPASPAPAAGTTTASGSDPAAVAILVVVILAIAAVTIIAARRKPRAAQVGDDEDAEEGPTEVDFAEPVTPGAGLSWGAKRGLIIVAIIAVVIVAAFVASREAVKPKLTGDVISRTLLPGQPCATINVALAVPGGADPTATAEKLFAALTPMGVVNTVSYNVKTSSVAIGFCESTSSETAIRTALAPTGLLAQ